MAIVARRRHGRCDSNAAWPLWLEGGMAVDYGFVALRLGLGLVALWLTMVLWSSGWVMACGSVVGYGFIACGQWLCGLLLANGFVACG